LRTDEFAKAFDRIGGASVHKGTKIKDKGDVCSTTKNTKGSFCNFNAPLLHTEKLTFQRALHHI